MLMTATLAERLGLISAAEGERLECDAWQAELRLRLHLRALSADVLTEETPAERALRRAGALRSRPTGDGIKACVKRWQRREQRLPRGGCPKAPAGHTLAMAWEVRSMRAGGERCT